MAGRDERGEPVPGQFPGLVGEPEAFHPGIFPEDTSHLGIDALDRGEIQP